MKVNFFSFIGLGAACSCSVFLMGACSESKEVKLQRFLERGNERLAAGDHSQAMHFYQQAIGLDPCYIDALNNAGTVQFKTQHYQEALDYYNKAISCDGSYLQAYFNRFNAFMETREYYRALEDIDHVIKVKPDTAAAYFSRGLVLSKLRQYTDALNAFDKSMSIDPLLTFDCKVNSATVKTMMKQFDEAESELKECIAIRNDEPNVYNTLGLIAAEKNQFQDALTYANKALTVSPDQPYFLNNRGFAYLGLGKIEEAETDINKSITIDPYNAWAYRNKGVLYLMKGDHASAERVLLQALGMDIFIDKIHFYLGLAYFNQSKKNLACEQFRLSDQEGDNMVTAEYLKECRGR